MSVEVVKKILINKTLTPNEILKRDYTFTSPLYMGLYSRIMYTGDALPQNFCHMISPFQTDVPVICGMTQTPTSPPSFIISHGSSGGIGFNSPVSGFRIYIKNASSNTVNIDCLHLLNDIDPVYIGECTTDGTSFIDVNGTSNGNENGNGNGNNVIDNSNSGIIQFFKDNWIYIAVLGVIIVTILVIVLLADKDRGEKTYEIN